MNLKESMKPLIYYWWVMGLVLLIVLGGTYFFNRSAEKSFDGVVNVIVQQKMASSEAGEDYKYDGYYAVVANQQLSDTLETWLVSPDVVYEIYQRAQINPPTSINALSNIFVINKEVSQSIKVMINTSNQEEGEKILTAMLDVMRDRVEHMITNQASQPIFTVTGTQILVLPHEIDYRLQYGVGAMGGLFIGLLLSYFLYALREEKEKTKKNKMNK